ncbi:MAG: phosphoglucosamine mutase [Actinomycetes bacterium]
MSDRLFGTDGVRGLANGLLTANLATSLGVAAAQVLIERGQLARGSSDRPFAIVGRDTRASGEFLQAAVSAGLASAGVDVIDVGVLPTPAVAYLTDVTGADLGCMLSASHNPMPDNGIKFFARGGVKLDDVIEDEIESHLSIVSTLPTGAGVGRIRSDDSLVEKYLHHLTSTIDVSLSGLTVVVDGANGSAALVAPEVLRRAGADVISIHCEPDGLNINDNCGSTHLGNLVAAVKEYKADLGIAHDGDADRCLAVDASGNIVDGDQILAMLAIGRRNDGTLVGNTVVTTVMANLGFTIAMRAAGIDVSTTAVGDRYVLEEMRAHGFTLGGEQSGHVLMLEHATTGDGVLTGLQLCALVKKSGQSLTQLAACVEKLPQVLINVPNVDKSALDHTDVLAQVAILEAELGQTGRVLLRPSGTEPVIRVMVEAATEKQAQDVAQRLVDVVARACAL